MGQVIDPTSGKVNPNLKINPQQKMFLKGQFEQLVANHEQSMSNLAVLNPPVVKFFGGSAGTWLLSEVDPNTGIAFGLCDPGLGSPELGYVDLQELADVRFPPFRLPIERDLSFRATMTMAEYANEARTKGRIVT